MSEFWLWFIRPFAETAGSIALLMGLFLFAMAGLMVMAATSWVFHLVRRKIQAMWPGGEG
jgi:hypothetical protein